MTAQDQARILEQLRGVLASAGLEATDERLERLLPAYMGMRSGAERLSTLNLGETEPAFSFRLPAGRVIEEAKRQMNAD